MCETCNRLRNQLKDGNFDSEIINGVLSRDNRLAIHNLARHLESGNCPDQPEFRLLHQVVIALQGKSFPRYSKRVCYHHKIGWCELNRKRCVDDLENICETRLAEEIGFIKERLCPECGAELASFPGIGAFPCYLYCPGCNDVAYSENGIIIAKLR